MPQPFGDPLGDRSRELYGKYLKRFAKTKYGSQGLCTSKTANGTNWVDLEPVYGNGDMLYPLYPDIHDIAIYQLTFLVGGTWAGEPRYRVLIDGEKAYPFDTSEPIVDGVTVYLGTLSTTVRTGQACKVQFKSTDAADGAGKTILMMCNIAEMRG